SHVPEAICSNTHKQVLVRCKIGSFELRDKDNGLPLLTSPRRDQVCRRRLESSTATKPASARAPNVRAEWTVGEQQVPARAPGAWNAQISSARKRRHCLNSPGGTCRAQPVRPRDNRALS